MRYDPELKQRALADLERGGLGPAHRVILAWVGRDRSVLELGCATGFLSRELAAQGCRVVGVEIDDAAALNAAPYCHAIHVGDAQRLVESTQLGGPFQVVVMSDVLEHLVDPWTVLTSLKRHLAPGGRVLVSIPNVAFFKNRWNLLRGCWEYSDLGLMDRTHLRFFSHR
ncbi:class I SAM-dependent methyltransferase, partial [bacterium]|nr:class I SAM-dependent methyltransferase [candidate division CSSED10-310 bacterium]